MSELNAHDLASLVAIVIGSTRSAEDMRDHTGVAWDDVVAGIEHLKQRGVLREVVTGQYHVSQSLCAGPCSRGGSAVVGQEVVINPTTFRWVCAACWDAGQPQSSPAPPHSSPAPPPSDG